MNSDRGLFNLYMAELQISSDLAAGFEDEAFAIAVGMTHLRQVPLDARATWFEAFRTALRETPAWVLALPQGERRFGLFLERIGMWRNAAFGFAFDDRSLRTPNPRCPWSLWPFEFDALAPRVLGSEGGSAATGLSPMTPRQLPGIINDRIGVTQSAALAYIGKISPTSGRYLESGSKFVKDTWSELGSWAGTGASTVASYLFWKGIRAMAPKLGVGLTELIGQMNLAKAALAAWPATAAIGVTVGFWDIVTIADNRAVVMSYRRDMARRGYEHYSSGLLAASP